MSPAVLDRLDARVFIFATTAILLVLAAAIWIALWGFVSANPASPAVEFNK